MQRITVSMDDDLLAAIDRFMQTRGCQGRSEAMRDLVRAGIAQESAQEHALTDPGGECIAAVVHVYDPGARAARKRAAPGAGPVVPLAACQVTVGPQTCMEVTVLRGPSEDVQSYARHAASDRGVRHGRVVILPS